MKVYIDEKNYWVSSSGILGKSFFYSTLDLELENNLEFLFDNFLKSLSQNVRVKVSLFQEHSSKISFKSARVKDIKEIGFLNTKGLIHFEHKNKISFKEAFRKDFLKREEYLIKRLSEIDENKDKSFLKRLNGKPANSSLFKNLYSLYKPLSVTPFGLKSGKNLLGILKLKNSGNYPLSLKTLALALENIPKPLSFHISLEKMSELKGEKTLKAKSREEFEGRGQVSFEKYRDTQRAISEVELSGEELFSYEVHIILKRLSETCLRKDIALGS